MIIIPSNVLGSPSDPFFSNTVLLLKTVGTPGASNSAFFDDGPNRFVPTRSGDVTQGSLSPYVPTGHWSGFFNGSTDVSLASNEALAPRTGDFTFEGWMYPTSYSATNGWGMIHTVINGGLYVGKIGSEFYVWRAGQGGLISTTTIPALNTWTHVAAVRSGTTLSLYFNGVRVATGNTSHDFVAGTVSMASGGGNQTFGYLSNIRLVKGTAVYDPTQTTISVPASPLTAVSGTSLLLFQDNRFRDNSTNNFALTLSSTPEVQRFSPFPISNTVTTNLAATGSVTFDGVGDHLRSPTGYLTGIGTSDFTVEGWWTFQDFNIRTTYFQRLWSFGTGPSNDVTLNVDTSGFPVYRNNDNALITGSTALTLGTWNHVALSRASGTTRLYLNGVLVGSTTTNNNLTSQAGNQFYVGSESDGAGGYLNGNASNIRVTNTAVYTSAFTPPTTPLTAITGTSLLTAQDAVTVTDASTNNFTITRVGDARASEVSPFKRSTAQFGGSGYFDGAGDYLTTSLPSGQFGSGNFTAEAWVLPFTRVSPYATVFNNYSTWGAGALGLFAGHDGGSTTKFQVSCNGTFPAITSTVDVTRNVWTHLAVVRNSGVITLYVNGVANGTFATNATLNGAGTLWIGTAGDTITTGYFNGHIANFRTVVGTAVYTSNFTPPTAPVTAITGTSLLLNFDNAGIHDATAANALATRGDAKTSTAVTLFDGSTMSFDGTGDFLRFPLTDALRMGAGNYTIECWIRPNVASAGTIYCDRTSGDFSGWLLIILSGKVSLAVPSGGGYQILTLGTDGGSVPVGAWSHVAVSRESGTWRVYINGVFQFSKTFAGSVTQNAGPVLIGKDAGGAQPDFNGSISDLRITRAARYTTNFTPPSAELPAR